ALRHFRRDAAHLEEDPSGLDDDHPTLRRTLAAPHAGFGRLLRHRLVGKDPDEDLTPATHEARHHAAGRLDLAVRHPGRLGGLQAELAECQVGTLGSHAGAGTAACTSSARGLGASPMATPTGTPASAGSSTAATGLGGASVGKLPV